MVQCRPAPVDVIWQVSCNKMLVRWLLFVYECFLVRSGGLEPVTDSHQQYGNLIPSSGATVMSGDVAGGDEWSTDLTTQHVFYFLIDLLSCDSDVYLSCT